MTNWQIFLQKVSQRSPWQVLGLAPDANQQEIQEAFERLQTKSKGQELVKIREAYFTLMDPAASEVAALLVPGHQWNLETIYQKVPGERRFLGPRAWLKYLASKEVPGRKS